MHPDHKGPTPDQPEPPTVRPMPGKPETLRRAARIMDDLFRVPGTRFRFGIDPLLGFFPGIGDSISAVISLAAVGASLGQRLPPVIVVRMLLNVLINAAVGAIPFVGDAFSFWFKSNARNLRLVMDHAGASGKPVPKSEYFFAAAALAVALAAVAGSALMLFTIYGAVLNFFRSIF